MLRIKSNPTELKLELKVLSPTAVLTGEDYYDVDYTVKGRKFLVIDLNKFLKKLTVSQKTQFMNLIKRASSINSTVEVRQFLKEHADESVAAAVYEADEELIKKFNDNLKLRGESLRRETSKFRVKKYSKNP